MACVDYIDEKNVAALFPPRRRDAHKGNFGKILIVTGSPGMTGAGCLAAESALTAGAGLVYLAVPGGLADIFDMSVRESITLGIGQNAGRIIDTDCADAIVEYSSRMDAVAIGPGMSSNPETARAIRIIIEKVQKPLIIDADALTAVAADTNILHRLKAPAVLTPHEAEMARLIGATPESVARDRLSLAVRFAQEYIVTLVLKGRRSIVATPDGCALINPTGNPGMATAGAGDALTGILAAFVAEGMAMESNERANPGAPAKGMTVQDAATAAVYLHGLAGDLAADELGERSVRASDIIRSLPGAFKSIGVK